MIAENRFFTDDYTASGGLVGDEFLVTAYTAGDQVTPILSARSDGGFVVSWTSAGEDGSGNGVYSRVYSASMLNSSVVSGTSAADTLFGSSGADTLIGGAGADTYVAGNGSGADVIDNTSRSADSDKLLFGTGIADDQLWFQQSGNNLLVNVIGTSDSVSITDWYASSSNHVSSFTTSDGHTLTDTAVQNLVNAMATLTPPPIGQTTLTTEMHQQLDAVIAANWQRSSV